MRLLAVLMLVLAVAGCVRQSSDTPQFVGVPLKAGAVDGGFRLVDHHGRQRSLEDFRGKVVAIFFGYTHCPDVCPTALADMARGVGLMGDMGRQVQVLFVTLDPERDRQEVLAQYVPAFDPGFLGLYGSPDVVAETAMRFKIYYKKVASPGRGRYTIDHAAGIYVFDKRGVPRIYLNHGQKPADIAHDLGILAAE